MAQTWSGIGLIGAGVLTAFWSQECRFPDGSDTYQADYMSGLIGSGKSTNPDLNFSARASDTHCFGGYFDSSVLSFDIFTLSAPAAEPYWPMERMAAGLGLATVGALLATGWAEVPSVRVDLQRGGGLGQ